MLLKLFCYLLKLIIFLISFILLFYLYNLFYKYQIKEIRLILFNNFQYIKLYQNIIKK